MLSGAPLRVTQSGALGLQCGAGPAQGGVTVKKRPWTAQNSYRSERSRRKCARALFRAGLAGLLLPAWLLAQRIPTQELQQEIQFYTEPYIPVAPAQVRRSAFLVDVDAVVHDTEGRAVAGLSRRDFKIYDDGREQAIANFSVESAPPRAAPAPLSPASSPSAPGASLTPPVTPQRRYVALFFDDRDNRGAGAGRPLQTAGPSQGASFGDLAQARSAAEKFVQGDLRAGDEVGVFTASGSVSLPFTSDQAELLHAIRSVRWEPVAGAYRARAQARAGRAGALPGAARAAPPPPPPGADPYRLLMHIVSQFTLGNLRSAIAHLARMPGSRVLVLISSGFTTRSPELRWEVGEATNEALNAGVVVSAVDSKGLTTGEPTKEEREADDVMSELARDTGGTFFHNNNDLAAGLGETAALPEVSYRLAFAPANLKEDGRFHTVKVKVEAKGVAQVQARRGYFAPSPAEEQAEARLREFHAEVLRSDRIAQLPAQVTAQAGLLASGGKAVQVSMRLSPKALSFRRVQGRHLDKLNFVAALLDSRGKYVAGEMGLAGMELKEKTLAYLTERGIGATLVVPAPAGSYRLRVVIEDAGSGKLFATSRPVVIP